MSKPIVTYMRKKYRTLRQGTGIQQMALSSGHKKRLGAQFIIHRPSASAKKLRTSDYNQHELQLQTPYSTAESESLVFKLPSSRPLSPDHEFSPLPLAPKNVSDLDVASKRPKYTRLSNKFLKENVVVKGSVAVATGPGSRSRSNTKSNLIISDKPSAASSEVPTIRSTLTNPFSTDRPLSDLASPFSSRPPSPAKSSPHKSQGTANSARQAVNAIHSKEQNLEPSGTLCLAQPTRAHIQSAATSPAWSPRSSSGHNDQPEPSASLRRPSAPTASRPRLDCWSRLLPHVSDSVFHESTRVSSNTMERRSASPGTLDLSQDKCFRQSFTSTKFGEREKWIWSDAAVDFNRPPSQLSFHSDFFNDVQGVSTPLRGSIIYHEDPQDLNKEHDMDFNCCPVSHSSFVSTPGKPGSVDSWITDSLISPPSVYQRGRNTVLSCSWRELQEDVNSDDDGDVFPDRLYDDGTTMKGTVPPTQSTEGKATTNFETEVPEDGNLVRRAESLSVEDVIVPDSLARSSVDDDKTEKRGTICKAPANQLPCSTSQQVGRKRRGTIRASDHALQSQKAVQTRRNRSGTVVGSSAARRTRSGTIIEPTSQIKATQTSFKIKHVATAMSSEEGSLGTGVCDTNDAMDDDPINCFKEEWVDEDWPWVVADPPSPITTRTRNKDARIMRTMKSIPLHKRLASKHTRVGIPSNNYNEESDDELLLK